MLQVFSEHFGDKEVNDRSITLTESEESMMASPPGGPIPAIIAPDNQYIDENLYPESAGKEERGKQCWRQRGSRKQFGRIEPTVRTLHTVDTAS